MVSTEFFEGITTSKNQFMGFASQHTKQGYLSSFHLVSFVLFKTDVYSSSIVVVCTLTTRNHIQSNMQDRLLQLVQIYQYQAHKIKFSMIILNELVGVDITLNYSSCFGHQLWLRIVITQIVILELRLIVPYLYFNMAILLLGQNTVTWFYILIWYVNWNLARTPIIAML